MKQKLFYLAIMAAALTACNKNTDIAEIAGNEISLRALMNAQTKAAEVNAFKAGDKINVFALYSGEKYFQDDFTFSTSGFASVNKYYWPEVVSAEKPVVFSAIFNATQKANTPGVIEGFAPNADAAAQKDVLFAKKAVTETTPAILSSGVAINFRHALSELVVKVKNTNPNLSFDVKEVKVAYMSTQGDFNASTIESTDGDGFLTMDMWSNLFPVAANRTAENAYTQTGLDTQVGTTVTQLGSAWMLIPQSQAKATKYTEAKAGAKFDGSYIGVKLIIKNAASGTIIKGGTDGIVCCWPADIAINPGYKYTYTIDLAEGGYYEENPGDDSDEPEPIITKSAITFSAECTVDAWSNKDVTPSVK